MGTSTRWTSLPNPTATTSQSSPVPFSSSPRHRVTLTRPAWFGLVSRSTILPPSNLPPSSRPLPILIDPPSMEMLKGATVDFTTELIGSAFRVKENPQAKGSGCGCGVSWEAK